MLGLKKINVENKIVNAIGFQSIWWAIALYKEKALFFAIILLLIHFVFINDRRKEIYIVCLASFLGILMDSSLLYLQFFEFPSSLFLGFTWLPIWMIVLWGSFASTLNHCLSWVFNNKYISFFVGGLGGSSSYIAAEKLGVLKFKTSLSYSFLILTILWGIYFLILYYFKKKLKTNSSI